MRIRSTCFLVLAASLLAGNAAAATADKGRAVVQAAGQQLAQLLRELHALPLATLNMTL